jgi:mRNA interferase HigB
LNVLKVHLIKLKTIRDYVREHANAEQGFEIWLEMIKAADWHEPNDISKSIPTAGILGRGTNRVIFNIGGNKFRCICTYTFGRSQVHLFMKWIGTHAEYSKPLKSDLQYTITNY